MQMHDKNCRTVEFIMEVGRMCSGLVVISEEDRTEEQEEIIDELAVRYGRPLTLLRSHHGEVQLFDEITDKETICNNVVVLLQNIEAFSLIYEHIQQHYYFGDVILVTSSNSSKIGDKLLQDIRSERFYLLIERGQRLVEIHKWMVSDQLQIDYVLKNSSLSKDKLSAERKMLMGRYLTIATLDFPPIVFAKTNESGKVIASGIEPSIVAILADKLNFKVNYILPVNDEMWGTLVFNGPDSVTVTGLLGFLHRKEADVSYGDLHIQQRLLPYVDFTRAFRNNYECFLVPAPRPYAKWTALYHPFSPAIWAVTGLVCIFAVTTLRLLAKWSSWRANEDRFFSDTTVCFLFILGNMLSVQQPQEIRMPANRLFLIWWLLAAATVIPTVYRSGLISYITFPYTPAPIDTIQQLVDSPLKKISWGDYFKTSLLNSNDPLHRKLGVQFAIATNLTQMFSLLETGSWAVMSNQGNLRYQAATLFPPTSDGRRVHLVRECVFPTRSAFGLQKGSSLKPYFDKEIYRLVEAGIVEHISSQFAKKQTSRDPTKSRKLAAYSLDNLQGAFYLLGLGIALSFVIFLSEVIFGYRKRKFYVAK
ncbi:glutamate receptor ionotropic, delta-1-like [Daphnia carinata]|uniref:glutamate receptor ionotropic, delta-1-like n=1 Tax=Daphnia carinata TaxID=120202 RepID=UPI00257CE77A|nr:glutamate receptor ionotropic, delta-1-like [Daphnia carinata]